MARLFFKLVNSDITYIIIDTPLFSCLQWLYLATVLGQDKVHFINNDNNTIKQGKLNILPVSFVKNYSLQADLFISMWAISESSRQAQEYVAGNDWFNAKHLLIAYQKSSSVLPDAENIGSIVPADAVKEEIAFIPGNYYVFR